MTSSVVGAVMLALCSCCLPIGPGGNHALTAPTPSAPLPSVSKDNETDVDIDSDSDANLFDTCSQPKPWTPSGAE